MGSFELTNYEFAMKKRMILNEGLIDSYL